MSGPPDRPTIFPGKNPDLGEPTGNTALSERRLTRRSRKLQGGFPPFSQKDLANGPSTIITESELAQIPALFVTTGEDGIPRTYRSVAEIIRKRNGTTVTVKRRRPTPEANVGESIELEKSPETIHDNNDIPVSPEAIEVDSPVLQEPPEIAENTPNSTGVSFKIGELKPGYVRSRLLTEAEIPFVPPSFTTTGRKGRVYAHINAVGRTPKQNPFMPKQASSETTPAEVRPNSRKDNPKREFVFTEMPPELIDTYRKILLKLGFRNPDAQRYTTQLKQIAAEVAPGHGENSDIRDVISRATSLMHPSISPDAAEPVLTPQQISVISKDPVGYLALNIMQLAEHIGVPIPPMKYRVVDRLTQLHDKHRAVRQPRQKPLIEPGEIQK